MPPQSKSPSKGRRSARVAARASAMASQESKRVPENGTASKEVGESTQPTNSLDSTLDREEVAPPTEMASPPSVEGGDDATAASTASQEDGRINTAALTATVNATSEDLAASAVPVDGGDRDEEGNRERPGPGVDGGARKRQRSPPASPVVTAIDVVEKDGAENPVIPPNGMDGSAAKDEDLSTVPLQSAEVDGEGVYGTETRDEGTARRRRRQEKQSRREKPQPQQPSAEKDEKETTSPTLENSNTSPKGEPSDGTSPAPPGAANSHGSSKNGGGGIADAPVAQPVAAAKPVFNLAGVNVAAYLAEASDPPPMFFRSNKSRRNRRRKQLTADSPLFRQHTRLREQPTPPAPTIVGGGRQAVFQEAPFSSEEDVLRTMNEFTDSPALVYAGLLWKYAPEAVMTVAMLRARATANTRRAEPLSSLMGKFDDEETRGKGNNGRDV